MLRVVPSELAKGVVMWCAFALSGVAASAAEKAIPRPEHPRPDAERAHWSNLNGSWQFRVDPKDEGLAAGWFKPDAAGFEKSINVPFGWESELSGVHDLKYRGVAWYRRTFEVPKDFPATERVWLRFEAVDWQSDVWVNGKKVASHAGGYTPFEADVTDAVARGKPNTVVVRVFDPTDPSLPTGKQVGWYTSTSGIWQTVWLESRPKTHIASFAITPKIDPASVRVEVTFAGEVGAGITLRATSSDPTVATKEAKYTNVLGKRQANPLGVPQPNLVLDLPVDDPKLWSPESPHLYELTLESKAADGSIDLVKTYFGLRTLTRGKLAGEDFERLFLNGKPVYLRTALDQSFNPKGVYTAPDDAFLKRDIELAKRMGLNGLRIHIKPDEPRRLYWADKLGMMILEDMPNAWRQNAQSRSAWESTMREVIARDRSHPSIVVWVAFNETWGLANRDSGEYKKSRDTQDWVTNMVDVMRALDPSRLVEDQSPCNYDHVENTDLNSWHFYIDDYADAKRHIDDVVKNTHPGSEFNYCPGRKQATAPLINSEYGGVSAGGGDRDVSWCFRDLTTLLRRQPKIQGYVYTELSDIEWEHNGFADYDRGPKTFGYDAFVPGMTPADLQGADFVGFDAPPVVVAKPGEVISLPVFVSHYSDRKAPAKLKWWVTGVDEYGESDAMPAREMPVEWTPYGVKTQAKPVKFKIGGTLVGAVALVLEDAATGERLAANFVNVVVRPEAAAARVERLGDYEVALRFDASEHARKRWTGNSVDRPGKSWGQGRGLFEYRLKVPASVAKASPEKIKLVFEVSSKAGRDQVDWPSRVNSQDYPQTDARKWPSTLDVMLNGTKAARIDLEDDPADARGVLSHLARVEHGSYGTLVKLEADLTENARRELSAGKPLVIDLSVPDDAAHAGGLALFGATMGRYPVDPTVIIKTRDALPADLGVKAADSIALDAPATRRSVLLAAGDAPNPAEWDYTTTDPGSGWNGPAFKSAGWKHGRAGFGTDGTPSIRVHSAWSTPTIWLRKTLDLPKIGPGDELALHVFHDEDTEIYVNGKRLLRLRGYSQSYLDITLSREQAALFAEGRNTLAVVCRQTGGGQGIDLGLVLTRGQ